MPRPNQKARQIISTIRYVAIATADEHGQPWNTPVAAFYFDNDSTLYWASWQENQHSKNIRTNPKVFVVAYDSTPADGRPTAGVYMRAEAHELTDRQEVLAAAQVFKDDPFNPSDGTQYLGDFPRRIYKAVPQEIWLNDDDQMQGNFVDKRIKAEE